MKAVALGMLLAFSISLSGCLDRQQFISIPDDCMVYSVQVQIQDGKGIFEILDATRSVRFEEVVYELLDNTSSVISSGSLSNPTAELRINEQTEPGALSVDDEIAVQNPAAVRLKLYSTARELLGDSGYGCL